MNEKSVSQESVQRPSWDEYFMQVTQAISLRSTCNRGRSGAVLVRDRQILASGYAGAPPGMPHCDEADHLFQRVIHSDGVERQHCVRTVHAEQNAICQAARRGVAVQGATLYCRMTPCWHCAMLVVSCGIERVVCENRYHAGGASEELFRKVDVELEFFSGETEPY